MVGPVRFSKRYCDNSRKCSSLLKALYVSRNRHGHAEVTAAALYVLMYKGHDAYREGVDEGEEPKSFSDWRKQAELERP